MMVDSKFADLIEGRERRNSLLDHKLYLTVAININLSLKAEWRGRIKKSQKRAHNEMR